jgi:hypothetical protein
MQVVGVIVALIILYYLVRFLLIVVVIALLGVVYWGPAALMIIACRYAIAKFLVNRRSPDTARLLQLSADDRCQVKCIVNSQVAQEYVTLCAIAAGLVAVAIGTSIGWLVATLGIRYEAYDVWTSAGFMWSHWPADVTKGSVLVAVCASLYLTQRLNRTWIDKFCQTVATEINEKAVRFHEIETADDSIKNFAETLRIEPPFRPRDALKKSLDEQLPTLAWSQQAFQGEADRIRDLAYSEIKDLQRCATHFGQTMTLCNEATRWAVAMRSSSLIAHIDNLRETLESENLRDLLRQRDWNVYLSFLSNIASELNDLKALQAGDAGGAHGNPDEASGPTDINNEDDAVRVLNVPPGATIEQVARAYNVLRSIWHPDHGATQDHQKFILIKRAYDYLRDARARS